MARGEKRPVVMGEEKGAPSGVATLDADGKLESAQVPEYLATLDEDGKLSESQRPSLAEIGALAVPPAGTLPGQMLLAGDGTATQAGPWPSNPNLLDNWYFADPINQRGVSGTISAYGYFIDRWRNLEESTADIHSSSGIRAKYMDQTLENTPFSKMLTFSALTNEGNLITGSRTVTDAGTAYVFAQTDSYILQYDGYRKTFRINNTVSADVVAAKLELGSQQTLAHKEPRANYGETLPVGVVDAGDGNVWVLNDPPPNKAQELAKCKWYYRLWATEEARTAALKEKYLMRTEPVTSTITIDGTTFYAASADL